MPPVTVLFLYAPSYLNAPWTVCRDIILGVDRSRIRPVVVNDVGAEDAGLKEATDVAVERLELDSPVRKASQGSLSGLFGAAKAIARLAGLIRRERVDLIHVPDDAASCAFGAALTASSRAQLLVHYHVRPVAPRGGTRMAARHVYFRQVARRATCHLACSRFVASELERVLGVEPATVAVVHNPVDTRRFHPGVDGRPMRAEYGVRDDEVLVLQLGRLHKQKRQEDLLRALAIARRKVPKLRALVVGWDDPRYQGPHRSYRDELVYLRDALGLGDAVVFGEARPDAPELNAAADLACLPSSDEAFGLVVAEAMATGRPVIGADSGGIPEVIGSNEAGLVFPLGDVAALAGHLVRLATDHRLRARMGAAARARAESHFSLRVVGERIAAVYEAAARDAPLRARSIPTAFGDERCEVESTVSSRGSASSRRAL